MNNIISDSCYDSIDYIEIITGERPTKDISLAELEEMELGLWNYPLKEIDHIIENDLKVILVRFPKAYGDYEYRFCECETERAVDEEYERC